MSPWVSPAPAIEEQKADDAAPSRVAAVAHGSSGCLSYLGKLKAVTHAMQLQTLGDAVRRSSNIVKKHATAPLHVVRGWLAEEHHATSLTVDAMKKESPVRAAVLGGNSTADIKIYKEGASHVIDDLVQVKTGSSGYVHKALRQAAYRGMQKVVPAGMEDNRRGYNSKVTYEGVCSSPLSNEAADAIAQDPKRHFDSLRPNPTADARGLAGLGFLWGGGIGMTTSLVSTVYQKGIRGVTAWDGLAAIEDGCISGAASAAAAYTATVAGDVMAGGVAAGGVLTAYGAVKKVAEGDTSGALQETAKGAAGTAAAVGTSAVCLAALGPTGLGALACPLVATLAAASVRHRMDSLPQKQV